MKLVIVESPSKAKTLVKYLGKGYLVDASGGHVRDLPEKNLGVDLKKNFEPKYVVSTSKKDVIKRLKERAEKADFVYLATDPDREGEAISWHLGHCLGIDPEKQCRIEFNEISEKAVQNAIQAPRKININLVDAQQARRVLDRLVGYKLSPFLCKKIQQNLSAGRVQSVALRLVVEREREIINFKPEEYWVLTAILCNENGKEKVLFKAVLNTKKGKKIKPSSKEEMDVVLDELDNAVWKVEKIKKGISKSKPPMPFTTSTLQQDAVSKLSMSAPKVMLHAQHLYEGVDVSGEGQVALVTYIRTDSVRVSQDAQAEAKEHIKAHFGKEYVPDTPNVYKVKKNAQDAHEAIRPISLKRTPESLKDKIARDEYRLYKLIYERFLASQMTPAEYNSMSVDISAGDYMFKANGRSLLFKGFTAVYEMVKKETENEDDEENTQDGMLPDMNEGDILELKELKSEQKFTKPPARYTDASLVKAMEEKGIGRPSTYASIISVITKREYVMKDGKYMKPSQLGFDVSDMVVKYFDDIINTEFTAQMEEKLDEIEHGGIEWQNVVGEFFNPFADKLKAASEDGEELTEIECEKCGSFMIKKVGRYGEKFLACSNYPTCKNIVSLDVVESDELCEKCGAKMIVRTGRYGKYLACPNYPTCQNIKPFGEKKTDEICNVCGKPMMIKRSKFGEFLACSGYPECKNTKPLKENIVMQCPECGKDVIKRKSRFGKLFYGCTGYPACSFVSWDLPIELKCPTCGKFMVAKFLKRGNMIACSDKECGYKAPMPPEIEKKFSQEAPQAENGAEKEE